MRADAVDVFADQVREYCDFIKIISALALPDRLAAARLHLLKLYASALSLPAMPDAGEVDAGASPDQPHGWVGFEQKDFYWEVFDPYEQSEPVCGSLSDDLLDVYRDLQRGLALWDADHKKEAVWEWRFNFDFHWGDHAIDALRALHRACSPTA